MEQGFVYYKNEVITTDFYGRYHELVDRYGVSICAMKTDFFNVSQFSVPRSSNPDLTFYEQLGGCF